MRKRFHILHVFSTFAAGGPQVRVATIINALGDSFRHTIMAMDSKFDAADRIASNTIVRFAKPPGKRGIRPYFLSLCNPLCDLRPDLLVTYNWGSIEAVAAGLWLALCPVLHHEDGFGVEEAVRLRLRRVWARRLLLNRIHRTIVPSQTLWNIALRRYQLDPLKVRLIPNGVDTDKFQPYRDRRLRAELGVGDNTVFFGYVGHLREEKNLPLLVRAFAGAKLPHAKLALIGDGPCRRALQTLVKNLGVEDQVLFLGAQQYTAPYFAALDVFVMSSLCEQMPMSLLEAMACGLPALCTDVGDSSEVLGSCGRPAIVPSGALELYRDALRTLALDHDLRKRLGAENRKRSLGHYSLERMVRSYESEYLAALGSPGHPLWKRDREEELAVSPRDFSRGGADRFDRSNDLGISLPGRRNSAETIETGSLGWEEGPKS